jgi:ubiquinone/menaquinone biosynthesis C-methylase UbiE
MATLQSNLDHWDQAYDWADDGEEWSRPWGNTQLMWTATILPRIRSFVPAARIVEIAPGRGRFTRHLVELCDELTGIDISPACVAACAGRFPEARFEVTPDGRTLPGVEDETADFVFSFDSLVHVDSVAICGYLDELARVLTPDGAAFLHHSNAATLRRAASVTRLLPSRLADPVARRGFLHNVNKARDPSVSGAGVAAWADEAGLRAVRQEEISWGAGRWLSDCISLIVRPGSRWDGEPLRWRNPRFARDAGAVARLTRYP